MRVGEQAVDVADLVLLGLAVGVWQPFEERVRRGRALEALELPAVDPEQVKAAATRFRYLHRVVSAKDFTAWLAARSMTVKDLAAVIRRMLLRGREEGRAIDGPAPEIGTILWPEAVCEGRLKALAGMAIDQLAAAEMVDGAADVIDPRGVRPVVEEAMRSAATGLHALGEPELTARLVRLRQMDACLQRVRAELADDRALDRSLEGHLLDWLQIDGEELVLATEGAAREARMLFVDDGLPLPAVAQRAGVAIEPRRLVIDSVPQEAGAALVATAPGEVAGPWPDGSRWRLMVVRGKRPPSVDDPVLRDRAATEILREALDRKLAGHVTWVHQV